MVILPYLKVHLSVFITIKLTLSGIEFSDLTILRIERGERFVPDYEIAVIADYFKVNADYSLQVRTMTDSFYELSAIGFLNRYPTPLIFSM